MQVRKQQGHFTAHVTSSFSFFFFTPLFFQLCMLSCARQGSWSKSDRRSWSWSLSLKLARESGIGYKGPGMSWLHRSWSAHPSSPLYSHSPFRTFPLILFTSITRVRVMCTHCACARRCVFVSTAVCMKSMWVRCSKGRASALAVAGKGMPARRKCLRKL